MVRDWMRDEVNCNLFPKNSKIFEQIGIPVMDVFLASIKSHINFHFCVNKSVGTWHSRHQLVLDIPDNGNNKCSLSIGDEMRQLINRGFIVFDTSLKHTVLSIRWIRQDIF